MSASSTTGRMTRAQMLKPHVSGCCTRERRCMRESQHQLTWRSSVDVHGGGRILRDIFIARDGCSKEALVIRWVLIHQVVVLEARSGRRHLHGRPSSLRAGTSIMTWLVAHGALSCCLLLLRMRDLLRLGDEQRDERD